MLLQSPPPNTGPSDFMVAIMIFGPIVVFLSYYSYLRYFASNWENGQFPKLLRYNRDNLLEAYICLAARMIQSDTKEAGKKVVYMNTYFNRHFPDAHYDFSDSLTYSYRNPISIQSVSAWLVLKLPHRKQRIQIMYFLAGLAFVDGDITSREMKILLTLRDLLKISPKEFESVIGMYQQKRKRAEPKTKSSKKTIKSLACKILGVSEHASMDEIKKAYRSLVKIHHPDRFSNESLEQQNIAKERFIEIQKAYEALEQIN